jgi:hypothetical protein
VPRPCLRGALSDLTEGEIVDSGGDPYAPKGATALRYTLNSRTGFRQVSQFFFGDTAAALQTYEGRVGIKFTAAEADTIGAALGRLLIDIEQRCDARPKSGMPRVQVHRD